MRQAKPGLSIDMKSNQHDKWCPSCSQSGGERSNLQAEAWTGELVSRNASELDSAPLHYIGATKLPEMMKSATVDEATLERSRRAPRGDWRQRARKERQRNLRGPRVATASPRESDGPIVAWKGLINLERRGPAVSMQPTKPNATA